MNEPLMTISRQTFKQNIAEARQVQFTQLPPWAQSGTIDGWIFPQLNESVALIFDLGRFGLSQSLPILTQVVSKAYDTLKDWLTGRSWANEDDIANAVEEWAAQNWTGPVWGEG